MPYVQAWNRDYAPLGLVLIGVLSPEFEFGKRAENINRGIRDHGLTYPIAIDNEFATYAADRYSESGDSLTPAHGTTRRPTSERSISSFPIAGRSRIV